MTQLIIKNIGPIKHIDITLNKVNLIIGPQSSGKSTINKIACYCSWVEKKISLERSFDFFLTEKSFLNNLVEFHKLKGYLKEGSYIGYHSEVLSFEYSYPNATPFFTWNNPQKYKRAKLSYIPAERNIVSIIDDWNTINLPENNIRNFMSDWNTVRKIYNSTNNANIASLDIKYYYDENNGQDNIINPDGSPTSLLCASSGIQSYVPLYILTNYFTEWIYNHKEPQSVISQDKEARIYRNVIKETIEECKIEEKSLTDLIDKEFEKVQPDEMVILNKLLGKYRKLRKNNSTQLYIEEPELNLFPSVQRSVLYYLIQSIQKREEDRLFITTHSPYILYSLNNCIMGWIVKNDRPKEIAERLESRFAWIDPNLVSAWQIKDGEIISIQEEKTRNIAKHYFNQAMNETMNEYYTMINYFNPKS